MICRNVHSGELLEVNDLNTIKVAVDRSETELTETALNAWRPGLVGPPHLHEQKEQIFFVIDGEGTVNAGDESYQVKTHDLVYVPANMPHQTIVKGDKELQYFLFNAFLDSEKEGHVSFKDHIEKVKNTRSQQAKEQKVDTAKKAAAKPRRPSKYVKDIKSGKKYDFGSNSTILLLDRAETEKSETTVVSWHPHQKGATVAHDDKEQTFLVLSGTGKITINGITKEVKPDDVIFVPFNTPHTTEAGDETLTYLCLNTIIKEDKYRTFDEMYNEVSTDRIRRWKEGDENVGL